MKDTLKINEIFYSIQGESTHAGKPCVFVRLTYCNLRCTYCDTEYAFYDGHTMTLGEIEARVESFGCKTVEITGGEPLIQAPVHDLMRRFCDLGYEVLLETGGSLDISTVDRRVKKIVDFKCPSSAMMDKNLWSNTDQLRPADEVKFVVGCREDFDWAVETIDRHRLSQKVAAILFSPVFDKIEPVTIAQWILDGDLIARIPNIRFQLQMHKFIWSPLTRGV